MKKHTTKIFAMLLLIALATAALASCGIVFDGEYRFGLATIETDGSNIAAAVILDASDRIALVRIDELEVGKNTSKKALGTDYGMSQAGKKEWCEQIAHLEKQFIGKTAEEVLDTDTSGADIKAGCTIYVGSHIAAVALAAERAKVAESFTSTIDHIAISLSLIGDKAGSNAEYIAAVSAAALDRGVVAAEEAKFLGAKPIECKLGVAVINNVVAAVIVSNAGKVVLASIDEYYYNEEKNQNASKKELGKDYGMSAYGGKEWFEQIEHLEKTLIGKSAADIEGVSSEDADIKAGCTMGIDPYVAAVLTAMSDATSAKSFTALATDLSIALKLTRSEAGAISAKTTVTAKDETITERTDS